MTGSPGLQPPRPRLSVVAPAFNQAETIYGSLGEIAARLETTGIDYELIVVSDGSADTTHEEAARHSARGVRVMTYDRNLGKGYALRTGSSVARGDYVAWIDSDMDLDPARLGDFLARAVEGDLDAVVGSKRHPDSEVSYPRRRRVYSWLYQRLVRVLFSLDVRDTQVGMKLFRREVLEEVLPVVLVKRYAFDLEILAVARSFGFDRISEAPIRLEYRFGASGVNWRAIAQALWDTAAVFYRLRILRYYERRRLLARRIAAHRPAQLPALTVVIAPVVVDEATRAGARRMALATPPGTRVVVASPDEPGDAVVNVPGADVVNAGAGSRAQRIARVIGGVTTEVTALVNQGAHPSDGWSYSALALFGDATVGAVAGPTVARLGESDLRDAAGILSESRIGVGGARVRHHVGRLREVGEFPASNLFVRTDAVRRTVERGLPLDDDLCGVLRSREGLAVLCSPDVVVTSRPAPLYRPYLGMLHRLGRNRGERIAEGRRPRLRHLAPVALVGLAVAAPVAAARGSRAAPALGALAGAYAAMLACFAGVVTLLHRRPRLGALAAVGAAASHLAFGTGIVRGAAGRIARAGRRDRVGAR